MLKTANFITSRIIQQKLKQEYGFNILSRNAIIDGVIENLTDHLPKSIIRTDIVGFYENIDSVKLVNTLSTDGYLPINQLVAIKSLIYEYRVISGSEMGLPRGNGISAYLAEVLLKDFDTFVKNLDRVVYYARFVDDIIIIVQEDGINTDVSARSVWKSLLNEMTKFSLQLHPIGHKTTVGITNPGCTFDYLGYRFIVKKSDIKVGISNSKLCRYKEKISTAFWEFFKDNKHSYGKKITLLRNRMRYLVLETRLSGIKKGVKVGLQATYPKLTDLSCLNELDLYLNKQLQKVPKSCSARLQSCKFSSGYSSGKKTHFLMEELKEIVCIWKGL